MQELEAEVFALRYMRKFNIHRDFPEEYKLLQDRSVSYVIQNIYEDIEKGLKFNEITFAALNFCKMVNKKPPVSTCMKKTGKKKK